MDKRFTKIIMLLIPVYSIHWFIGPKLAKIDEEGIKLCTVNRNNQALMQYAMTNYGTTNLSVEDWKKCEDNFKLNLLYQVCILFHINSVLVAKYSHKNICLMAYKFFTKRKRVRKSYFNWFYVKHYQWTQWFNLSPFLRYKIVDSFLTFYNSVSVIFFGTSIFEPELETINRRGWFRFSQSKTLFIKYA